MLYMKTDQKAINIKVVESGFLQETRSLLFSLISLGREDILPELLSNI